ncbi:MAG: hypothetical protein ABEJ31_10640 [Haloarculaceae archaeon]
MSTRTAISVVAVVLLVAASLIVVGVGSYRATQAAQAQKHAVDTVVTSQQAPADWDGDGINDSADKCPTRPETTNGFQDGDGCPDVVTTTGAS